MGPGRSPSLARLSAAVAMAACVAAAASRGGTATIRVTLSDDGVLLSPASMVAGTAVFRVANTGRAARDFEIGGKKTSAIPAGKTAILRASFRAGPYRYASVAAGRGARFSGFLGVLRGCPKPSATTVTVTFRAVYRLLLSQKSVPCGTVTFHVANDDTGVVHDFNVALPTLVSGEVRGRKLQGGQSTTMVVKLPYKGQVYYLCEEPEHAENGESGYLTVR